MAANASFSTPFSYCLGAACNDQCDTACDHSIWQPILVTHGGADGWNRVCDSLSLATCNPMNTIGEVTSTRFIARLPRLPRLGVQSPNKAAPQLVLIPGPHKAPICTGFEATQSARSHRVPGSCRLVGRIDSYGTAAVCTSPRSFQIHIALHMMINASLGSRFT